jgi:hypothetical protein
MMLCEIGKNYSFLFLGFSMDKQRILGTFFDFMKTILSLYLKQDLRVRFIIGFLIVGFIIILWPDEFSSEEDKKMARELNIETQKELNAYKKDIDLKNQYKEFLKTMIDIKTPFDEEKVSDTLLNLNGSESSQTSFEKDSYHMLTFTNARPASGDNVFKFLADVTPRGSQMILRIYNMRKGFVDESEVAIDPGFLFYGSDSPNEEVAKVDLTALKVAKIKALVNVTREGGGFSSPNATARIISIKIDEEEVASERKLAKELAEKKALELQKFRANRRCNTYKETLNSCASAGNIPQCMKIKMGAGEYSLAQTLC